MYVSKNADIFNVTNYWKAVVGTVKRGNFGFVDIETQGQATTKFVGGISSTPLHATLYNL